MCMCVGACVTKIPVERKVDRIREHASIPCIGLAHFFLND